MRVDIDSLRPLFNPKSIAVIGATPELTRIGGRPLKYLLDSGYEGKIYPVNPKYPDIAGVKCYGHIGEIPEAVDLALIALPGALVLDAVKACAVKGVRALIIFSAGFAEISEEGRKNQEEITRIARESNMRILGPNCLGMFHVDKGVYCTFSAGFESGFPIKGRIGFVSQSGAFGSYVFTLARENQVGFSYWMATGNESDVDVADCLAFLAQDPGTDVIACYIEGAKDGKKLTAAFEMARKHQKPIVMLKVGRSEAGMKAAISHTASLVGADEVYDAVFKKYGVYRAETIEEFLDVANACAVMSFPKGDRVGIFTVSGGVGIMMADQLTERGLKLPEPSREIQQKLLELLPYAGVGNPIDTTAQLINQPNLMGDFMEIVLEEDLYDLIIVFLAHVGLSTKSKFKERLDPMEKIMKRFPSVPGILVTLVTPESKKMAAEAGFAVYEDPSRAVTVAAALNYFASVLSEERHQDSEWEKKHIDFTVYPNVLTEDLAKQLLSQYGIPVTREVLVKTPEKAVEAARRLKYPVVLKGMSPQILHKTDAGLVKLNVRNDEEVLQSYQEIVKQIDTITDVQFDGVLIQEMLQPGLEMIVGMKSDPVFGPMVMVGFGGIYVEVLKDVVMRPAPLSVKEAKQMIALLRGVSLLEGVRGQEPGDIKALSRLVSNLSHLAVDYEEQIDEIDINPVIVHGQGNGVKAVDALIKLKR